MEEKDIKYLPVKVEKLSGTCGVRCEICDKNKTQLWVEEDTPISADDIKAKGAEEYRQALIKFSSLDINKRVEIVENSFVFDIPADDFCRRIEDYFDMPKTGEIWERKTNEERKVIIRSVDKSIVKIYYTRDGVSGFVYLSDFKKNYKNTGEICKSLIPFINELNRLNA